MKYSEFKKMQRDELEKKCDELKLELMKLNAQVAIGTTPKSTKQIREIRRNLARIEALQSEMAIQGLSALKQPVTSPKNHTKVGKRLRKYIHS